MASLWILVTLTLLLLKYTDGTQEGILNEKFGGGDSPTASSFNYFDADLLETVADMEDGNIVISPASVKALLALLLEAADDTTLEELRRVLRLPSNITEARATLSTLHKALQKSTSDKVIIDSVAQVFVSNRLSPNSTYARSIKDLYQAGIAEEDFSHPRLAAKNINKWISGRTNNFIPTLIEEDMITPETLSILTSAIYFEGKWKNEFQPEDTKPRCFYSGPSLACQQVPMMAKTEELLYKVHPTLDAHVVKIPYQDERFAMVIVLPRKRDGMKRLSQDVGRLYFPELLQNMGLYEVNLKMPRYTVEYGTELTNTMRKMRLSEVFSDTAKLPYMVNNRMGKIGAMVHKAKIEVTEKGTKAAAATGAGVVPLMYGLDVVNIDVDHPFYYFIIEQSSQAVLFAGRLSTMNGVTNPLAAAPAAFSAQQEEGDDVWEQNLGGSLPDSGSAPSKTSGLENYHYSPTTTLPKRYTKDSIIHFPVTNGTMLNNNYLQYVKSKIRLDRLF